MGVKARSISPPGNPGTFWLSTTGLVVYEGQPVTIVVTRGGAAQGPATITGEVTDVFASPRPFSVSWLDGESGPRSAIVSSEGGTPGSGSVSLNVGSAPIGAVFGVTTGTITLLVLPDAGDAKADWELRSRADGVFWACNGEEFVRGIQGYVTQPVKGYPSGISGRLVTPIASIAEVPGVEEIPLKSDKYAGDMGDGHGPWRLTPYPGVSGKVMHTRVGSPNLPPGIGASATDWFVLPWAYAPLDFRDPVWGTGLPNQRKGIKGTQGDGQILPFVETRIDDPTLKSSNNPANRPMVRQFFMQMVLCSFEDWRLFMNRMFFTPPWPVGVSVGDRDNKICFVTGGQSSDQFALKLDHTMIITTMGYRNSSSTVGYGRTVSVKGKEKIILPHTALDFGGPALTSANRSEDWMKRYGPSAEALVYGRGVHPDGVNRAQPKWEWRHPGLPGDYLQNNRLSNPDNNHPYGGFPVDGRPVWPDFDWPANALAGVLRANTPMVVQCMVSDQISRPINQDTLVQGGTTRPFGPRITALWASQLGDPPTLLGFVGSNPERGGPGMIPSRAMHRGSGDLEASPADDGTLFKIQENAIAEDRSNCGYMIVGALDGFPEPTNREFYALRANPESGASLRGDYVGSRTNKSVDPGSVQNFGGGLGMGWATGELRTLDRNPGKNWQFRIESTEYTGQHVTVPNAYNSTLALVSGPVHKFRLARATSVVPRARSADYIGDCINVLFVHEDQRPFGRQLGYGEVMFGLKPPPWPRHPTAQLPWPQEWTE
jgi:hypothetical protein